MRVLLRLRVRTGERVQAGAGCVVPDAPRWARSGLSAVSTRTSRTSPQCSQRRCQARSTSFQRSEKRRTVAHSKLDFFIERKNATVRAPHGLDETAPLPSRVLKQSSPFVFDLDAQAFSLPCRHGARVGWEGRAAKRAGRLDEEPERPRRIPLVV